MTTENRLNGRFFFSACAEIAAGLVVDRDDEIHGDRAGQESAMFSQGMKNSDVSMMRTSRPSWNQPARIP